MKATYVVLLACISLNVLIAGCTTNQVIESNPTYDSEYNQINDRLTKRKAVISLNNGTSFKGKNVVIGKATTSWNDVRTDSTFVVDTSTIREIKLSNKGKGALDGLGVGAAIGGAIGAGVGIVDGSNCGGSNNPCGLLEFSKAELALGAGLAFGGLGGAIGMVGGLFTGRTEIYTFESTDEHTISVQKKSVATNERRIRVHAN